MTSPPRSSTTALVLAMYFLARDIQSADGVANAAIRDAADRLDEMQLLLIEMLPLVTAQHGAEHMLDGFKPKKRAIDSLLADIKKALKE